MTEIIEKAKELGALLQASEQVQRYNAAKAAYDGNEELQKLIQEFNLQRMSMMNLSSAEEPDEARMAELEERIKDIYTNIMQNPVSAELQDAKQAVEAVLNQVNGVISFYVTGEEPGSCTHDCSTCGGCH